MEQKWIDRLNNFEATPPPSLWDRVESALDQDTHIARKLKDFEATPPPAAWDRIARQLDAAPQLAAAPVIELERPRRSFAPYLVAAGLIGILLVATAIFFNRPEAPAEGTLARVDTPATKAASAPASTDTVNDIPEQAATNENTVAADQSRKTGDANTAHTSRSARSYQTGVTAHVATGTKAVASLTNHSRHVDDERYLVRAYNDGSVVRFSKKVSPVVDCAENAIGFTQSLCRVSIGAVQDKLATAITTDFGSLIERLQDLEKASR